MMDIPDELFDTEDLLESRAFYELMQVYRHNVTYDEIKAFENVKELIRKYYKDKNHPKIEEALTRPEAMQVSAKGELLVSLSNDQLDYIADKITKNLTDMEAVQQGKQEIAIQDFFNKEM